RLGEPAAEEIEALCRLVQDDNALVQVRATEALGKLGAAAAGAAEALAGVARTGTVELRVEALRAPAVIQPPRAGLAFGGGLKDPAAEVRVLSSAGLIKAADVPAEVHPQLIESLRDPEAQVRANAARVLARLSELPAGAVPALVEGTADLDDG